MILAAVAVLAGAVMQSAVGFGFAVLCAPLLFVALGPVEAVWSLNVLALVVNGAALLAEGRRPRPLRLAVTVLAWSLPGLLAGGLILRAADPKLLQVALTVVVVLAVALRGRPRPAPEWAAPATGVATGVLATSLSTAGPPLVLLLLGRGHAPERVRDTLAVVFIAQAALALGALAITGSGAPDAGTLAVFAACALAGQLAGRPLFARLAGRGYEGALTAVLILSAAVGLAAAFL